MGDLEKAIDLDAPDEIARLEPWKSANLRRLSDQLAGNGPLRGLEGKRVVLAVLEVHDLVRDALAKALPRAGAEVVLLNAATSIEGVAQAANDEDADAIIVGTYNGNALALGERLSESARRLQWEGRIFMGGILNQDTGEGLPIDARPGLQALGVQCVERVEDLGGLLAAI